MSLLGQAFAAAPEGAQRSLAAILRAAVKLAIALGASSELTERAALAAGDGADEASDEIDAYDAAAGAVGAPSVRQLLGGQGVSSPPSWPSVEALYVHALAPVASAVRELRQAYDAAGDLSIAGRTLRSGDARAALAALASRVPREPGAPPVVVPVRPVRRSRGLSKAEKILGALVAVALMKSSRR